jgi:hypothetical protein
MKTLISFFFIMMMMLVACTKDQFVQEENLELKKAKVPVPMKADFCASPAPDATPMAISGTPIVLPNKMLVSGNATHMGKVDTEKSYTLVESLKLSEDQLFLEQTGTGVMTAANGDSYPITWWLKTSLANWTYIGEVKMFDGTGKFKGMTGTVQMVGAVDMVAGTNCWKADGFMEFAK